MELSAQPETLRILFVTTGTSIPSSRFRVHQYLPYLENLGIEATVLTGYGPRYNQIAGTRYGPLYKAAGRAKRAVGMIGQVHRYDAVFLQRVALPFSALPERVAARINPRIVFDFDDAIYLESPTAPGGRARRAFDAAVAASRHVVAGNHHLAAEAGAPTKTTVVPTVVDTSHYQPSPAEPTDRVVIGWMGTASNFYQLEQIAGELEQVLADRPRARLRIVSNARFERFSGHPQVEQVRWSADSEVDVLQEFDIGLMPLDDTPWSRGKCGFKLIQYMAVGRTAVASAVGANREIVTDGWDGVLVAPGDSWVRPLVDLIDQPSRRHEIGARARARVVAAYSIDSALPTLVQILRRVARETKPAPLSP